MPTCQCVKSSHKFELTYPNKIQIATKGPTRSTAKSLTVFNASAYIIVNAAKVMLMVAETWVPYLQGLWMLLGCFFWHADPGLNLKWQSFLIG